MEDNYLVLRGGQLIDGNGGIPIDNSILIAKGEQIEAVGRIESIEIPKESEVIDISGKTVMPGLIDAHVHLLGVKDLNPLTWTLDHPVLRGIRAVMDAWKLIDNGFTMVRDCANQNCFHLKKVIEEGGMIGPRILCCGGMITQTGGHGDMPHSLPIDWVKNRCLGRIADGPDECRKAAREQFRDGADFLKLCSTGGVFSEKDLPTSSQYTIEEIKAIVEEAHCVGAKVACHAQGTQGIKNAIKAGVDTIEHGYSLDDEAIEMMIKHNTYLIPTLAIIDVIITKGASVSIPDVSINKARSVQEDQWKSFEMACKAGVKIGFGTDCLGIIESLRFGENATELDLHIKAGRSPMEAILSATKINSEALGLDDKLGTLEKGKLADFIIVNGDPLRDINILRKTSNIISVYKGGIKIPRLSQHIRQL